MIKSAICSCFAFSAFGSCELFGGCGPAQVMPRADASLADMLHRERVAGMNWNGIRNIFERIVQACAHLHDHGLSHNDLKPKNIVRIDEDLRLIDLECASPLGGRYSSTKMPSQAFLSPEFARLVYGRSNPDLSMYVVTVAHDMWSLGVILFHLCARVSLWHADDDDNLCDLYMEDLMEWDEEIKEDKLRWIPPAEGTARTLLSKLLEREPAKRTAHFGSLHQILDDPFLKVDRMRAASHQDSEVEMTPVYQ